MRIVLDAAILVRAGESPNGPAHQLLVDILSGPDMLVLSNEILFELGKVLRYSRMRERHGQSEVFARFGEAPQASLAVADRVKRLGVLRVRSNDPLVKPECRLVSMRSRPRPGHLCADDAGGAARHG